MSKLSILSIVAIALLATLATATEASHTWQAGPPLLLPGATGTFDETAVKDPSVVFHGGNWHVFYTARGQERYSIGYVAAPSLDKLQDAPRHKLLQIRGKDDPCAAAPQVFYFEPQQTWYLVYQTRDSNYQPVYSTTKTIEDPTSWTAPKPLVEKDEKPKWIDFWVICDDTTAYFFYTRNHRHQYVMTAPIAEFPKGFANPTKVFSPIHEAVHIYKAQGRDEYHMLYENRVIKGKDFRQFGLATAPHLLGPWTRVTDDYATGKQLRWASGVTPWTEEVSHGEMLRTGCDQRLEYNPAKSAFLIQGMPLSAHNVEYPMLPWSLGVITKK